MLMALDLIINSFFGVAKYMEVCEDVQLIYPCLHQPYFQ